MGHSLCSFILRQIPRRSPTHNAVYFTTTRLGGYNRGNTIPATALLGMLLLLRFLALLFERYHLFHW